MKNLILASIFALVIPACSYYHSFETGSGDNLYRVSCYVGNGATVAQIEKMIKVLHSYLAVHAEILLKVKGD